MRSLKHIFPTLALALMLAACQRNLESGSVIQVTVGTGHTCATRENGEVVCWGAGLNRSDCYGDSIACGQSVSPQGNFSESTAGDIHSCALSVDGRIVCWGHFWAVETEVPPEFRFTQISAGFWHSCGITADDRVTCWGYNGFGNANPPGGTCDAESRIYGRCYGDDSISTDKFSYVSAGLLHTCALRLDGTVNCWGAGKVGETGDSNFGQSAPPEGKFVQLTAGSWHTCGLQEDGRVACWGDGKTTNDCSNTAEHHTCGQSAHPADRFVQISAGNIHTCGVTVDGSIKCWGANSDKQAFPPSGDFVQVSAGHTHSCGVTSTGTVKCWGSNFHGQTTVPSQLQQASRQLAATTVPLSPPAGAPIDLQENPIGD